MLIEIFYNLRGHTLHMEVLTTLVDYVVYYESTSCVYLLPWLEKALNFSFSWSCVLQSFDFLAFWLCSPLHVDGRLLPQECWSQEAATPPPSFCKFLQNLPFCLKFWRFYASSPLTFQLAPALSNSLRRPCSRGPYSQILDQFPIQVRHNWQQNNKIKDLSTQLEECG